MKERLLEFKRNIIEQMIKEDSPFQAKDLFIAGGCIRSLLEGSEIQDIDIFFKANVEKDKIKEYFKEKLQLGFITENATTIIFDNIKYQFVTTHQGTPFEVINEFDFTMNMNYFDMETDSLYIHDEQSIKDKRLKINLKCRNKLGTLSRILKFTERGYKSPSRLNLLELGVQLTQCKPVDTFFDLQESSKLYFSRSDYDNISVVSNLDDYDTVVRNYRGSAV